MSVSVWLPRVAHTQLVEAADAEGVSLAVLARRAAASAMATDDGRLGMPAPSGEAVDALRTAGYALNQILPAWTATATRAQDTALTARTAAVMDRITHAASGIRLLPRASPTLGAAGQPSDPGRWRLVRVTTDAHTAQWWAQAGTAAGFRSSANWVRDALAGAHGLAVARPPTPATIAARAVSGRVLGLLAQSEAVADERPAASGVDLRRRIDAAAVAIWAGLESLLAYGGDPKARR
ncbi:hypothetical protein CKJ54_24695 (plasmid) [Mycobacterium marseillense]|uniref:Uncharacterized protein n=1 Tax=Mycobacterium marseillense TaxID=701042 RepID=A0AAC9YQX9_9MYCO|nr:hypothetical protein CKJ54_24695 [Mycobacterium marseillense]